MLVNLAEVSKKKIYEHTRGVKKGDINNGLVKNNFKTDHILNFKDLKILVYIYNRKCQKIVESSII